MTDPRPDIGAGPDRESPISAPRWVKVFGLSALALVLLLVVLMLMGGHGPGRHTSSSGLGDHIPTFSAVDHDVYQP